MEQKNEYVDFHGYKVYRSGKITTSCGNELKGWFFTYPYSHVSMSFDGKQRKILRAKLIFELFSGKEVPKAYIVRFKDDNPQNCDFNNLYLESRAEFAKMNPHTNERKLSKQAQRRIKKMYYNEYNEKNEGAPSTRELAKRYKCSLSTIQKILKEGKEENARKLAKS